MFKTLGIIGGGLAAAAVAAYMAGGFYFQSHFYPGTTVNGVDASGAQVSAVEEQIAAIASDYSLTLIEADGKEEQIKPKDVGLVINAGDGQVQGFMESQNGWGWINALAAPMEFESKGIVSYDKKKLKKTVKSLGCVNNKNAIKTEDAYPVFDGKKFVAMSEVYGTEINEKRFEKKLGKALVNLKTVVSLEGEGYYNQPNIKADSKEMQNLLDQLNRIADVPITYTVGSQKEKVPKDVIAGWLTSADGLNVAFNDEAMMAYMDQMSAKYNTFGLPKLLKASSGATVSVPGGSYGWKIDKEAEIAQLKTELIKGDPIKRDFVYQYTAHTHDGPDYGNSYVEVNLSAQHVYMYTDGRLVCDGPCVSGDVSKGNITHRGAYQMTYKEKNAILRGQGYDVPVDYWMPFNGNEGLHDAQWRKGFGGGIYLTNGSHGCVNLPLSTAAGIFGEVEKGFPVLVYSDSDIVTASTRDEAGAEADAEADIKTEEQQEPEETAESEESEEPSAQDMADDVISKINAIGVVSAESGAAVSEARSAYDALSPDAKAFVTNQDTLAAAEASYSEIEAKVEQLDWQNKAAEVSGMISLIGPVTTESGPAIDAAEAAYMALPEQARGLVQNTSELASKRAEYNALMGM